MALDSKHLDAIIDEVRNTPAVRVPCPVVGGLTSNSEQKEMKEKKNAADEQA